MHPGAPPPSLRTLLSQADVAMYAAKRAGKGKVERYRSGMTLPETEDLMLSEPLRLALEAGDVKAYFQPVMDLANGGVRGFEALVRWNYQGRAGAAAAAGRGGRAIRAGARPDGVHAGAGLRPAGRLEL